MLTNEENEDITLRNNIFVKIFVKTSLRRKKLKFILNKSFFMGHLQGGTGKGRRFLDQSE